jgi:hypothetical protein
MIDLAINAMAAQLNQYLQNLSHSNEDLVVVSNLLGPDGAPAPNVSNRIILFLTAIERDTLTQRGAEHGVRGLAGPGPLFLNLYVMAAANFTGNNYPEALKFLSLVVGFFHGRPVLDHSNCPELAPAIDKLILDIENTPPQAMSNIWGVLGGRYLPSVLYRVRMVVIDSANVHGRVPRVTSPGAGAGVRKDGAGA